MPSSSESSRAAPPSPIACDLSAIPAEQRAAHLGLVRSLFGESQRPREVANGLEVSVSADRFADVVSFIDNERRCCPHLSFAVEVPTDNAPLLLRVTGPGAVAELRAAAR
jgi:hypothetical protein